MIVQKVGSWPWPQMTELRRAARGAAWLEVTEEDWSYALEVLPPVMLAGGVFQVGEPADHDAEGRAVRATYVRRGGRVFAAELTQEELPGALRALEAAWVSSQPAEA